MSFTHWLRNLRSTIAPGQVERQRRRSPPRRAASCYRPQLEVLEDRTLPSLFVAHAPAVVGGFPASVAVGDFNGDGLPDLAVATASRGSGGAGTVSVLLGDGTGRFGPAQNFAVGSFPESVAVGDFNRDGIPDLAVANAGNSTVSVLLGDGTGGFRVAGTPVPVGSNPISVAVGDFNGDGLPDLAVANLIDSPGTVSVLLGDGTGGFEPAMNFVVGARPRSVAVGDFNGDGLADLAVANEGSNSVSVLLGDGTGGFRVAGTPVPVGSNPISVAVGDFNGDGLPDLAVANFRNDTVSVLLGDGKGNFGLAQNFPVGVGPFSVAVGDFNRDGSLDLAVANVDSSTVSVLLGDGTGRFGPAQNFFVGSNPPSVAVGDFNRDGGLDLAVANHSGNVSVLLNQAPVTTTTVTADRNPSVAGQLTTFTATVATTVPGQRLVPTGVVTFLDGAAVLGTGTLVNGRANFSTFTMGTGYHAISAVYQGDPNFSTSTAPVLEQLVNQDTTTTTLVVSANPAIAGEPLTLTATVTGQFVDIGLPTGTVVFLDDGVTLGTATLGAVTGGTGRLSGAVATLTTAVLAPGNHGLKATYVGDDNFTTSRSGNADHSLPLLVNAPAPVLRSLDTTALPEGSADFTLTLNGSGFLIGSDLLGGSTVLWNGTPLTISAATATRIQVMVPPTLLADEGTALVTVSNPGPGGGPSLPQTFTVGDAPVAAGGANISVRGNKNFSGVVTTFTDANPGATAADFTAIIVWDNGTANLGRIGGGAGGPFTVSGSHTFGAFSNVHTVTVTVFDKGGKTATVTDNLIDPPGPQDPPSPAAGDPAAAAVPGASLPVVSPEHHRRHTAAHAMLHHRGHGGAHPKRHHNGEPFAQ